MNASILSIMYELCPRRILHEFARCHMLPQISHYSLEFLPPQIFHRKTWRRLKTTRPRFVAPENTGVPPFCLGFIAFLMPNGPIPIGSSRFDVSGAAHRCEKMDREHWFSSRERERHFRESLGQKDSCWWSLTRWPDARKFVHTLQDLQEMCPNAYHRICWYSLLLSRFWQIVIIYPHPMLCFFLQLLVFVSSASLSLSLFLFLSLSLHQAPVSSLIYQAAAMSWFWVC